MKLLIIFLIFIAITDATDITKKEENSLIPTPTSENPTQSRLQKRSQSTLFTDIQNITIFEEGWGRWEPDWVDFSWPNNYKSKVKKGRIQIDLNDGEAFSIQSNTLESRYGFLNFEFMLVDPETEEPIDALINFITFDANDYVNEGCYEFNGSDYMEINQEIKDHDANAFLNIIKRFAWQNHGNERTIRLLIRKIIYRDIDYSIIKCDKSISIIDRENCKLSSSWEDISSIKDTTTFIKENDQCIMKIKSSDKHPSTYKLNKKFLGGKFSIKIKSETGYSPLMWYSYNTDDDSIEIIENSKFSVYSDYSTYTNEDFETEDEYNTIMLKPYMNDEEIYYISSFDFCPITNENNTPNFSITHIEKPDEILNSDGLHWENASWGTNHDCYFSNNEKAMICSFIGRKAEFPGFGAYSLTNKYDGGTLIINFKVEHPERTVHALVFDINTFSHNIKKFKATTEYEEYKFKIPNFNQPFFKIGIQEGSELGNKYYIRSITYYPSYISLPSKTKRIKSTTTSTIIEEATPTNNVNEPKTNEEIYEDEGYDFCTQGTKISYAFDNQIFGYENQSWCAILPEYSEDCWSILYGYQCCTEKAKIVEGSAWGKEEDNTKCGVNSPDACWAEELGYQCCSIKKSKVIFVDQYGAWGIDEEENWCGII